MLNQIPSIPKSYLMDPDLDFSSLILALLDPDQDKGFLTPEFPYIYSGFSDKKP
jgi:hypothetical protein